MRLDAGSRNNSQNQPLEVRNVGSKPTGAYYIILSSAGQAAQVLWDVESKAGTTIWL